MENKEFQFIDREFLLECSCGDGAAADFFQIFYDTMHAWDDLVDRDKPAGIDTVFIEPLFNLSANSFYAKYQHLLQPVVIMSINAWRDSTWLEREHGEKGRRFAYVLRTYPADVLVQIALITGGYSHMRAVSIKIREILINLESFEDYSQELGRA